MSLSSSSAFCSLKIVGRFFFSLEPVHSSPDHSHGEGVIGCWPLPSWDFSLRALGVTRLDDIDDARLGYAEGGCYSVQNPVHC